MTDVYNMPKGETNYVLSLDPAFRIRRGVGALPALMFAWRGIGGGGYGKQVVDVEPPKDRIIRSTPIHAVMHPDDYAEAKAWAEEAFKDNG